MSTPVKLNALLTLASDSNTDLKIGEEYTVHKDGFRILPLNIPMELADHQYNYLAKVKVVKLVVTPNGSDITFVVLKLFTQEEKKVFTENFIKP